LSMPITVASTSSGISPWFWAFALIIILIVVVVVLLLKRRGGSEETEQK
jgi:type II secretory pathway component PulF